MTCIVNIFWFVDTLLWCLCPKALCCTRGGNSRQIISLLIGIALPLLITLISELNNLPPPPAKPVVTEHIILDHGLPKHHLLPLVFASSWMAFWRRTTLFLYPHPVFFLCQS